MKLSVSKRCVSLLFRYWGWGGVDDDFYRRLKYKNLNPTHLDESIGRFRVNICLIFFFFT